jgi:uncharacterized protein
MTAASCCLFSTRWASTSRPGTRCGSRPRIRRRARPCSSSAAKGAFELTLLGQQTLAVNAVSEFTSDLGNILALRTGSFAVVFRIDSANFVKISLRSLPGFDVSRIAVQFGGGGHPQASAFRLPMAKFADFLAGTLQPA